MRGKINKIFKTFFIATIAVLFVTGFFVFEKKDVEAQNAASDAASAADAIAVRVLSNPNHYGPAAWYKDKGFSGSPSATTVDGYPAVQDGRTVYVDVGNVIDSAFFTNIYLLSYNQSATKDTSAILSRIASNWKFNTNLQGSGYCFSACSADTDCSSGSACNAGRCQISCQSDTDCPSKNSCISGRCQQNCLEDKDCGNRNFCDSLKAMVTRDTIRLAGISDLKVKLTAYKAKANHYPLLSAGSYIPGQSLSTWPSWNGEFASELGASIGIDPINKLGYCDGYDAKTCWDSLGKKFYGTIPDGLPGGSYAYAYSTDANGANYKACAVMESTGYNIPDACPGSAASGGSAASNITINCGTLAGVQGQSFSGYVTVTDPKNSGGAITVSGLPSGFSAQAVANNPYQKQIVSANAGSGGTITVSYPNATSKTCTISVSSNAYVVYPVTPTTMNVVLGKTVNFTVSAYNSQKNYSGLVFTVAGADVNTVCSNIVIDANGRATCNVSFTSSKSFSNETVTVTANDTAKNTYTTQQFTMNVNGKPPVIAAPNCPTAVRLSTAVVKTSYNCQLTASSPTGNTITSFQYNNLPPGLSISSTGLLSGSPTVAGAYDNISITATDQYGVVSAPLPLHIAVNTYCGDNAIETPNGEQKGGSSNNGTEQCDGTAGVPATPAESAANFATFTGNSQSTLVYKYGCNSCVLMNDGYCGDNTVQTKYGEQCDSTNSKCCQACTWTTGPTVLTPIIDPVTSKPADYTLANSTPNNVASIMIPASSRGVEGMSGIAKTVGYTGSFDYNFAINKDTDASGPAIVFATDLTGSSYATVPTDYQNALNTVIAKLYQTSVDTKANIYVGAFGFGKCAGISPNGNPYICSEAKFTNGKQIANLKNFTNIDEGFLNETLLLGASGIGGYQASISDITVNGVQHMSGAGYALNEAVAILNDPTLKATSKYIIILSDGFQPNENINEGTPALSTIKTTNGITIYAIAYSSITGTYASYCPVTTHPSAICAAITSMCNYSSDNGSNCFATPGKYSFLRSNMNGQTEQQEITGIYTQIGNQILSAKPAGVKFSVDNGPATALPTDANGNTLSTGSGIKFYLPSTDALKCSLGGTSGCTPIFVTLTASFTGSGNVEFNNFNLSVLPPCGSN